MEKITGNEPVTPCEVEGPVNDDILQTYSLVKCYGLTIRQHFAAMAMQRLCASNSPVSEIATDCATAAVRYADALITELNKTP